MSCRAGLGTQSLGAGPYSRALHFTRDSLSSSMTHTLNTNRPSNRLETVYGHGLRIPKLPHHGTATPQTPTLLTPVCPTWTGGQGPHTSPAQEKTSRSRQVHADTWVRRTCEWCCRQAQLWPSEGRRKSFPPASSSDKQAPAVGELALRRHPEIATVHGPTCRPGLEKPSRRVKQRSRVLPSLLTADGLASKGANDSDPFCRHGLVYKFNTED